MRAVRVKLTTDLTRYHPELKVGTVGVTTWQNATWGVYVDFPTAGRWDIISSGLQVIDEEYLKEQEKFAADEKERLKRATNVVATFRRKVLQELEYVVDGCTTHASYGASWARKEGLELIQFFKTHGIAVKESGL
jgi:hypothetical protein